MNHWHQRINERLSEQASRHMASVIDRLPRELPHCTAHNDRCGVAVLLFRDRTQHGRLDISTDGTGTSNGDCLYAIVRNRRVFTVMWRRSVQPATREALRVDHIIRVAA